jgi:hypothetical protein
MISSGKPFDRLNLFVCFNTSSTRLELLSGVKEMRLKNKVTRVRVVNKNVRFIRWIFFKCKNKFYTNTINEKKAAGFCVLKKIYKTNSIFISAVSNGESSTAT